MALVRFPAEGREVTGADEIAVQLAALGVGYERWESDRVAEDASPEATLEAYRAELDRLRAAGGYTTADVIDLQPDTPGLDAMLGRFSVEHWHDEDEVRFILVGRGLFHVHGPQGQVCAIEVEPGDLLRVPRGTYHWFDLCGTRRIRAIRLFQDRSGWTPHYTGSGVDRDFQPLCLGPAHIPVGTVVLR